MLSDTGCQGFPTGAHDLHVERHTKLGLTSYLERKRLFDPAETVIPLTVGQADARRDVSLTLEDYLSLNRVGCAESRRWREQ
ncbi:MAG: hypothetical protein KGH96_04510 [Sphingomonadales bacterium]|nr:hypothetical protein [Sphingomonadales bacterium]